MVKLIINLIIENKCSEMKNSKYFIVGFKFKNYNENI